MISRNVKVQDKKFESFKTNIWSFYENILKKKRKKKLFPKDSSFIINLINSKKEYYPDNPNVINFCRLISF